MSMLWVTKRIGQTGTILCLVLLGACGSTGGPHRLPGGYRLVQKDRFQALYGPDGRLVRLLQDGDQDGRADAVIAYRSNGQPERGELDTDGDGSIDRWEYFRVDGSLESVAVSRRRDGRPDQWDRVGLDGRVHLRDRDDDADGRVDRTDYLE